MNIVKQRTECVARTPASVCQSLPRCYKRPGRTTCAPQLAPLRPALRHVETSRVSGITRASADPPAAALLRQYRVPEQQPWWKQLAKTTLFLPALVAAALLRPAPASAAQLAWKFWQSRPAQPARYENRPRSSWQAAEATAVRGAERWQRTVDMNAFKTAGLVLSVFSMLYVLLMFCSDSADAAAKQRKLHSRQPAEQDQADQAAAELPAAVEDDSSATLSKISTYQQLAAEQTAAQKQPVAVKKQPSRGRRIADAIRAAAGRPSSSSRQSSLGMTPQQFTAGMEMPTPTRPLSIAARDPHRPAAVRDLPFTPAPIRSYSDNTVTETRSRSYAPTVPYMPLSISLSASENGDDERPSPFDTYAESSDTNHPADDHSADAFDKDEQSAEETSAKATGEKVMERAQEIRDSGRLKNAASKSAKAAAEPADLQSINVKPLIQDSTASQNGAGHGPLPTDTVDLPDSQAPSAVHAPAFDTVDMPAEDTPPAVGMGQRVLDRAQEIRDSGQLKNAADKSAKAAAESGDLKSINVKPLIQPVAAYENGVGQWPSNGIDRALTNGAAASSNGKVHIPSAHQANGAAPSSGNGKITASAGNDEHVDTEKRNGKLVSDMLEEVQEAYYSTPQATHSVEEPVSTASPAQDHTSAPSPASTPQLAPPAPPARKISGDTIVLRLGSANPLGDIFDGIVGRNGADRGAQQDNIAGLQASHPITQPSKYDPLPGLLNAEPPRARPAMDPFAGILGIILGHTSSRAEARAKRAAQSKATPAASAKQVRSSSVMNQQATPAPKPSPKPTKQSPKSTRPSSRSRVDVKIPADKVGSRVPLRKWEVCYPFSSNGSNGVSENGAGSNGVLNGWPVKEKQSVAASRR